MYFLFFFSNLLCLVICLITCSLFLLASLFKSTTSTLCILQLVVYSIYVLFACALTHLFDLLNPCVRPAIDAYGLFTATAILMIPLLFHRRRKNSK
ncbi:hypothetical protein BDP27DRAFT_316505 [Rhodocollybia butyracea]|uniref:Uncharacterized protein n=1 Tax=Rhodocollybia butyracea TaxID=206335 RepID=A0A9P5UCI6_9AGAR|nr:hypothetical protein BDP27DRAFT_316505 [Rhodocollybia butyracea]